MSKFYLIFLIIYSILTAGIQSCGKKTEAPPSANTYKIISKHDDKKNLHLDIFLPEFSHVNAEKIFQDLIDRNSSEGYDVMTAAFWDREFDEKTLNKFYDEIQDSKIFIPIPGAQSILGNYSFRDKVRSLKDVSLNKPG
jgi:hypothetical protein